MKRTFSLILAFMLAITGLQAAERHRYNFNSAWKLSLGDDKNAMQANHNDSRWKTVTSPRAFNEDEAFQVLSTNIRTPSCGTESISPAKDSKAGRCSSSLRASDRPVGST